MTPMILMTVILMGMQLMNGCASMTLSSGGDRYEVAVYYFPQWHVDPVNAARFNNPDWTEWLLVRDARPRFEGHDQPKVPLWGFAMEDDPEVMGRKIAAAAGHGVDVFIFDWYWHKEGPFLNGALDRGFLGAKNCNDLKFAVMWANHDVHDRKGQVSAETFTAATDQMIRLYFPRPNYWRVDGGLYVSFFEVHALIKGLGGIEQTAAALEDFRARARQAGHGKLHINAVAWGIVNQLPEEMRAGYADDNAVLTRLGFDSVTDYHWIQHRVIPNFPKTDYAEYRDQSFAAMKELSGRYELPYYPLVCMGWDSSPRCPQNKPFEKGGYPWLPVLVNNTPEQFRIALEMWKSFMDQSVPKGRILMINSWNEWTEGSYIEPDAKTGFQYLEAIREVFGK